MGEFYEHCPVISNQIRAIRPFVTFVFQNCPASLYFEYRHQTLYQRQPLVQDRPSVAGHGPQPAALDSVAATWMGPHVVAQGEGS